MVADIVHVQYADFAWNGTRCFEDLYEAFSSGCNTRLIITLHEHPWLRGEHENDTPKTVMDHVFGRMSGASFPRWCGPLDVLARHTLIHVHHGWHERVLTEHGIPADRIVRIPFPVAHRVSVPIEHVQAFEAKWGLSGKRVIAMAGFIFERKRVEMGLRLTKELGDDVWLCMLGGVNGGPSEAYLAKLTALAEELGVKDRFVVTGYLPEAELRAGLATARMFLAPYKEMSSSSSVSMAIGAGLPVVGHESASLKELQEDGAGVLAIDTDDPKSLRESAEQILSNRACDGGLRHKNADYASRNDWSGFAARWMARYAEAAAEWKEPGAG